MYLIDIVDVNNEITKANSRGGKRTGSGRKPKDPAGKKETSTWGLAPDVLAHIKQQPNQAEYIESLVRADMIR